MLISFCSLTGSATANAKKEAARIVAEKAQLRRLIRVTAEIENDCYGQADSVGNIFEKAEAYRDSFNAQTAMFPAMIQGCVQSYIDAYKDKVLAYKMPGAGGGGYLACVVENASKFAKEHTEAIRLTIRRAGL